MGRSRGATPFSISSMISCREIPADLFSVARSLDRNYILDGFSRGKPADYFTQEDADDAVGGAERTVQFYRNFVTLPKNP